MSCLACGGLAETLGTCALAVDVGADRPLLICRDCAALALDDLVEVRCWW